MAIERRPSRPPSGPIPAAKPTTRVPAKKVPTTRFGQRPGTRGIRTEGGGTSRGVALAPKKSNTPLIVVGAAGGALLLIIIIAVAASGSKPSPDASKSKKKGPEPVDVSTLERNGKAKCEEGVEIIQRAYSVSDKAALQRGIQLITEGNQLFDKAHQLSGNMYDTKKYNETLKMARGKVLELK